MSYPDIKYPFLFDIILLLCIEEMVLVSFFCTAKYFLFKVFPRGGEWM